MKENNRIINFRIDAKDGLTTGQEVQDKFHFDEAHHKGNVNVYTIDCIEERIEPTAGSQSVGFVEVIVGIMGKIIASYLYDVIKDYIKGDKKVKISKDRPSVVIETPGFTIKINSDEMSVEELTGLVESLLANTNK